MSYYKPIFKKLFRIKNIFYLNFKILKFQRNKWKNHIINFKQQILKKRFKKFKLIDQNKFLINSYSNKFDNYKNNYKYYFNLFRVLKIINLSKLRKQINIFKTTINNNKLINKLDNVLVNAKFCLTLRFAKNIIINGFVLINQKKQKNKSYNSKSGDIIQLKICFEKYEKCLINSFKWPICLNNIIINYKCKEIIVLNNIQIINHIPYFPYYLQLIKLYMFL